MDIAPATALRLPSPEPVQRLTPVPSKGPMATLGGAEWSGFGRLRSPNKGPQGPWVGPMSGSARRRKVSGSAGTLVRDRAGFRKERRRWKRFGAARIGSLTARLSQDARTVSLHI